MVKPHPKKFRVLPEILYALASQSGSQADPTTEEVDAGSSLEAIFLAIRPENPAKISISIVGFGTNARSAILLEYPYLDRVSLVLIARKRIGQIFRMSFNAIFNRSEFLRRRHVSTLMSQLQSQLYQSKLVGPELRLHQQVAPSAES